MPFISHQAYWTYMENIAAEHFKLKHNADERHFAIISLSADPYGGYDLTHFLEAERDNMHFPFLLAVSPEFSYQDNNGEGLRKILDCAFIVLDQYPSNNDEAERDSMGLTETIGEHIIARMREDFRRNYKQGIFSPGTAAGLPISLNPDMPNVAGTRFNFSVSVPANQFLNYNPAYWLEPLL